MVTCNLQDKVDELAGMVDRFFDGGDVVYRCGGGQEQGTRDASKALIQGLCGRPQEH